MKSIHSPYLLDPVASLPWQKEKAGAGTTSPRTDATSPIGWRVLKSKQNRKHRAFMSNHGVCFFSPRKARLSLISASFFLGITHFSICAPQHPHMGQSGGQALSSRLIHLSTAISGKGLGDLLQTVHTGATQLCSRMVAR